MRCGRAFGFGCGFGLAVPFAFGGILLLLRKACVFFCRNAAGLRILAHIRPVAQSLPNKHRVRGVGRKVPGGASFYAPARFSWDRCFDTVSLNI